MLWACATCGLEYPESTSPPEGDCAVCADDRQYLPIGGQRWANLAEIQAGRQADIAEIERGLFGITVAPSVGIGHRPLLVRSAAGNVLFDPPGFIDDGLIAGIRDLGGIAAIATSHPHLTGLSVTFSQAFGNAPIWYGEDDQKWIRRPDPAIRLWRDQQEVLPGLTLIQCGGHFAGSAVLHWAEGADAKGAILTGDTVRPNADRATVSFMRSYPNLIPLSPRLVQKIVGALEPWSFDRIYGGFGESIQQDGQESVWRSAERYIGWMHDEIRDPDERAES